MQRLFHISSIACGMLLAMLVSFDGTAQDFHLSQYEASPMLMNPAMTGQFKGDYRATLHYRTQWSSIVTKPFRSTAASFDSKVNDFKFGGYIYHTMAGAGTFASLSFVLSGAYDFKLPSKPHNHFVAGLQLGGINKSINPSSLTFEDQYDASNGGTFSNSTAETYTASSAFLPEVNLGFLYQYTNTNKRLNPFIGASAMHITEPNEGLMSAESKLPMRINIHPGVKVHISKKFSVLLDALAMQQENVDELMFGVKGEYQFENSDAVATFGITRRTHKDAVISHLALKYKKFQYRFSYDVNTSGLDELSNNRGGFELSITYISSKINKTPKRSCPDL